MTTGRPIGEDDLQAYVDQALAPVRREEVKAYLDRHPDIAARIAGYEAQRDALRDALKPIAEEPVPQELSLARLIEARERRRFRPGWRAVAAAVLFLALGGISGWSARSLTLPPDTGMVALGEEAAASYAVYAPDRKRPVEIAATDRDELVRWVSNRLQHPVSVPDLASAGYRFMGGRLVATQHGPAGLFLYDDDKGIRIAVLVRPMAVEREARMSELNYGRVAGFAWANNGIGYSLVSEAPAQMLHPLADEVRRQISGKI
ncbi:MAG: anti-sigma factor [Rhodospirillaceae bacterium]|nr:MAG: anti-sigma factor [Rhodospirillaceae bacterium]